MDFYALWDEQLLGGENVEHLGRLCVSMLRSEWEADWSVVKSEVVDNS